MTKGSECQGKTYTVSFRDSMSAELVVYDEGAELKEEGGIQGVI